MTKVFHDENVAEKVEIVVEEKPAKPKRKRKPLSDEAKAKLVERLAKARDAKKNARAGQTTVPVAKPKKEKKTQVKTPVKQQAVDNTNKYREHQLELQNLRNELENQKLKFEIESLKKNKSKPIIEKLEPIIEDIKPTMPKVDKIHNTEPIIDSIPIPPKPIKKNLANRGDIWNIIKNSD